MGGGVPKLPLLSVISTHSVLLETVSLSLSRVHRPHALAPDLPKGPQIPGEQFATCPLHTPPLLVRTVASADLSVLGVFPPPDALDSLLRSCFLDAQGMRGMVGAQTAPLWPMEVHRKLVGLMQTGRSEGKKGKCTLCQLNFISNLTGTPHLGTCRSPKPNALLYSGVCVCVCV